jgi:hypothetical protein
MPGQVPCGVVLAIDRAGKLAVGIVLLPAVEALRRFARSERWLRNQWRSRAALDCSSVVEQRLSQVNLRSVGCWSLALTGQMLATMSAGERYSRPLAARDGVVAVCRGAVCRTWLAFARLAFVGVLPKRMNREEFFAKLSSLDEARLRKVLWSLYWRGSAPLRERIEAEIDPAEHDRRRRAAAQPPDPDLVLYEVREFVELARAGSYMAGDRRVSPKERTHWRVTFRRLAADAQSALRAEDAGAAEEALALIIDLACEMRDRTYFRSEDPVEAARFVVSDAVALLWESVRDRHGVQALAQRAPAQLIRWELRYGWTHGWGQVHDKESTLAVVIARLLPVPDLWTVFADRYLDALDQVARAEAANPKSRHPWVFPDEGYARRNRTDNLAEWHGLLLERLAGSEAEDRLDRLVRHPALGGPELIFLRARLACARDDLDSARKLVQDCLQQLPGHAGFTDFAAAIGAELPQRARELAGQRSQWQAAIAAGRAPE